ncbi:hypothetical protein D9758_000756 [Tetrapyrgos nigripes]|uniref:Monopolin complex subunit Csm1/Pcs1 C-terminal domain-containing protein n=1 Tax=Tetrapyrgos nigripes TaxID=182062 RepID=A0A8H5LY22_9AGAR|nr:hypothetical protein D9758_000756 [Tetrapyrgos nigripes]
MSDDSVDLGGLSPTTPIAPTKTSRPRTKSKLAGPSTSSKPANPPSRKRQKTAETVDVGTLDVIDVDGDEEEDELASTVRDEPQAKPRSRGRAGRETATINGRQTTSKAKGKGKIPASRSKAPQETIDMDNIEQSEDESLAPSLVRAINAGNNEHAPKKSTNQYQEERLRKRAEQAEERCEILKKQLDEFLRVRRTEAEELFYEEKAQYEAQLQAKDKMINELNSALARIEPLSRQGKTSIIHLLTREAADLEKRQIEEELTHWKDLAQRREGIINNTVKEKDAIIAEKETIEKELRFELNIERERNTATSKQVPGSAQRHRGGVLGNDEPKATQVVKFYEDLTNMLITGVKHHSKSYFDLDDWNWTCIYTYVSPDRSIQKSLSFNLKACHEPCPGIEVPKTKEELTQTIYYVPLDMEKESPDYVERLGFLGAPFSFNRDQLALFVRTMHDHFGKALGAESGDVSMESNGADDEVQLID